MRQTLPNLCWLRDSERRGSSETRLIRPEKWSDKPSATGPSFYAPEFDLKASPTPWLVGEIVGEWPTENFTAPPRWIRRQEPDSAPFFEWHHEILQGITSGRFEKVVPWAEEKLEFELDLHWSQFPGAFAPHSERFSYGFQFADEGLLGVTPELLVRVRGEKLETMALAGTAPVDGPSLLTDRKERFEHELVIEDLRERLAPLGELSMGETIEAPYGSLKHLRTPISVQLSTKPDFLNLVERLHPTAALGGRPRAAAQENLKSHTNDRRRFGAPFGYVLGEEMLCVVAIRGLQWRGRTASLTSGCGVVAGSLAEKEWQELALKRRSTARSLGLEL